MPASAIEFCYDDNSGTTHEMFTGLTKRETFAMAAMQGLLPKLQGQAVSSERIAICSVEMADALLRELNKGIKRNGN